MSANMDEKTHSLTVMKKALSTLVAECSGLGRPPVVRSGPFSRESLPYLHKVDLPSHICNGNWLIVNFGESRSLEPDSDERVEGEKLENPYESKRSMASSRDQLGHELAFTKTDDEPGNFGEV